jgi:two-component system, chemotaxis family, protein-glutamate methylesterase/glutaminase
VSLRVLVVNDSPTMRASLRVALLATPDVEIVGELEDGADAADAVLRLRPDVVLMDVVMPTNGYEATRAIMAQAPTPVVMITAAENPGDERVVFAALGAGALGIVSAPPPPGHPRHRVGAAALVQLLRTMAGARVTALAPGGARAPSQPDATEAGAPSPVAAIGIVASAGGPPALVELLRPLVGAAMPPILVVQHMVLGFQESFAAWLSSETKFPVAIASSGAPLAAGTVTMAPADHHLGVTSDLTAIVTKDAPTGQFRPSGDYLLSSLARALGRRAVGVVLTGMGRDGADGAAELKRAGGIVVAQSAESSVIDGMPRAVRDRGSATRVLSLGAIPGYLAGLVRGPR